MNTNTHTHNGEPTDAILWSRLSRMAAIPNENTSFSQLDCNKQEDSVRESSHFTSLPLAAALARKAVGPWLVTVEELEAMRDWVAECAVSEAHTGEDADEQAAWAATVGEAGILRFVARHYEGGVPAFLRSGPAVEGGAL